EEGIDYDEVFAPVAKIEAIRLFLAYASFMGFIVYQMDVKSAFLYVTIDEEVYVMQPLIFQDPKFPAKVYKVEKAMCGLHQASRAWYRTLSKYLLKNGFQRGTIDQTLFIKRQRGDFILVQVYMSAMGELNFFLGLQVLQKNDGIFLSQDKYVGDILKKFGYSDVREFEALMHEKFQMSAMGELNFFFGLQVLQKENGIFLSYDKYVGDILKKFVYSDVRSSNTPMYKENPWGKDGTGKDVDLHLYRSMIGSLMLSMPCETLSKEISTSILRLLCHNEGLLQDWLEFLTFEELWCDFLFIDFTLPRHLTYYGYGWVVTMEMFFLMCFNGIQWIVPLFNAMLVHQGAGSGTPTDPHQTHSLEAQTPSHTTQPTSSLPHVTTTSIPTVTPTETTPIRHYTRRTRIAQSSVPPIVVDEPASPHRDVSQEEACLTDSGFIAD
nr:hypothetical protein [Tanacetum cinerariifolium]